MGKLACIVGALAAALALAACVGNPRYEIEPGHEGAKGVRTIALLPLNLVVALPDELEYPSRKVSREVRRYLADAGRKVKRVQLYEARQLLAEVTAGDERGDGAPEPGDAAVARFVERLAEERSFDVVVLPSVVYRTARIRAVTHDVEWDGVRRKLKMVGQHQARLSMRYTADVAGKMPAVSLHVLVFDPTGRRIFESYAGVDLVHQMGIKDEGERIWGYMELMRNRLTNEDNIQEGVTLAFDPYVPPAPSAGDAAPGDHAVGP